MQSINVLELFVVEKLFNAWTVECSSTFAPTACKIHVAHVKDLGKPATTPCPGNNDRVDETGHEECKGSIGGALHTLCHCSAHNGSTRCAKRPLKEPTLDAPQVDSQDEHVPVLSCIIHIPIGSYWPIGLTWMGLIMILLENS